MMEKIVALATVIALAATVSMAAEPNASGSLALSGEVQGSIAILFWQDAAGYQLSEGASSSAVAIGEISAYGTPNGTLPNRLTKGMDPDGFHVSTTFQLQVVQANMPASSGYTLDAQLGDDDDTVWEIDGQVLSTTPALLASAEPYTTKRQHVLYAKFPFTKTATSLNDTITFTATAN